MMRPPAQDTIIRVPGAALTRVRAAVFTLQQQGSSPLLLALYVAMQMGLLFLLTWTAGQGTLGSCPPK
jgi:hypothetical protein